MKEEPLHQLFCVIKIARRRIREGYINRNVLKGKQKSANFDVSVCAINESPKMRLDELFRSAHCDSLSG